MEMCEPFDNPILSSATSPPASPVETVAGLSPQDLSTLLAHEFRGPVHALQAYLSVLLRERAGPLTDVQRDFLVSMCSLVNRLERLTDDVQVMVASGGSFSVVPEIVDLLCLVTDCRWELDPIAQGFGVRIDVVAHGRGSWQIRADAVRLEQIVINLLENAIRYGTVGSTVSVRLRQSREWLLLIVENDIVQEQETAPAEWMQPFVRGALARDMNPRGLGVGLTVVRALVSAHHGQIITRTRGGSIAFGVRLPRSKIHVSPGHPSPPGR